MKKIVILIFCVLFLSCEKNDYEKKLIYDQLLTYRKELKDYTEVMDSYIIMKKKEGKYLNIGKLDSSLIEFDKSFKKLKKNDKLKKIQIIDSFSKEYPLYLKSNTRGFDKISDTVFKTLIEIEFYRVKNQAQSILLRNGCK
ncbi:MAG: hypothetical protein U0T80_04880 [Flavobacteriaceae bacterium]